MKEDIYLDMNVKLLSRKDIIILKEVNLSKDNKVHLILVFNKMKDIFEKIFIKRVGSLVFAENISENGLAGTVQKKVVLQNIADDVLIFQEEKGFDFRILLVVQEHREVVDLQKNKDQKVIIISDLLTLNVGILIENKKAIFDTVEEVKVV